MASKMDFEEETVASNHLIRNFEWSDNRPHPLCIPFVVRQILNYLPLREVEMRQRVSKLWAEEAATIIKKKKLIVFYHKSVLETYNSIMEKTFLFPHTAFEMHCDISRNRFLPMNNFWNLFGHAIKTLEVHHSIVDGEALFDIMTEILPNLQILFLRNIPKKFSPDSTRRITFQNMKELILQFFPYSDADSKRVLKEMLISFPFLKKIRFRPASTPERIPNRMMNIVLDVLTDEEVNLPLLDEIDIRLNLETDHAVRLTTTSFPISKLHLNVIPSLNAGRLQNYLTTLRYSLTNLEIVFPPKYLQAEYCFSTIQTTILVSLTHLNLTRFTGSLLFIAKMPRLKNLKLEDVVLEDVVPNGFGIPEICHNLTGVKTNSSASCTTIYKLAHCFPSLQVLHVVEVDDEILRTIYTEMPFLTDLSIISGTFTDEGITGVPSEILIDIAETNTYFDANPEKLRANLHIGSLPNLTKLQLGSPKITDLSIILGLSHIPKLKALRIISAEITDIGMSTIADRMRKTLIHLDVSDCTGISEAGRFYIKEKLKNIQMILENPPLTSITFTPQPNRFVVTGTTIKYGRRQRAQSQYLREYRRGNAACVPEGVRERAGRVELKDELERRQRDRELLLQEQVEQSAYRRVVQEPFVPMIQNFVLNPTEQKELLEQAHFQAAIELNAGMMCICRTADPERFAREPDVLEGLRLEPLDRQQLEDNFIIRRDQIFGNLIHQRFPHLSNNSIRERVGFRRGGDARGRFLE